MSAVALLLVFTAVGSVLVGVPHADMMVKLAALLPAILVAHNLYRYLQLKWAGLPGDMNGSRGLYAWASGFWFMCAITLSLSLVLLGQTAGK